MLNPPPPQDESAEEEAAQSGAPSFDDLMWLVFSGPIDWGDADDETEKPEEKSDERPDSD